MTRLLASGKVLIFGIIAIFIAGCGGGSSTPPPPPPPAISVAITNKISTIKAGAAAVTFNATVKNDSANAGVTWTITAGGANCQPTCGSLSSAAATSVTYTPPAIVPATPDNAPTLVATSVTDSTKSDSDPFTVTSGANDNQEVTGQYAFLIGGFDDATGNQFAYIGSISVNGQGAITGGVEDINLPAGVQTAVPITGGTYTVGTDNRGTANITTALGTNSFAFSAGTVVNGVATILHVIEFDDTNGTTGRRGSGMAYLQSSAALSAGISGISGPFAFQFVGQNATAGSRTVEVGGFSITSGTVTGTVDVNDSSAGLAMGNAFTSTVASTSDTSTAGRVTNTVTVGAQVSDQVGYIVSSGQLLLMTTDSESSSGLVGGQALQQSKSNFTAADLSGTVIQYDSAFHYDQVTPSSTPTSCTAPNGYAEVGPMVFSTSTGTFDLDFIDGSTPGQLSGSFSSYTVSTNGHVSLTGATSLPDIWLVTTNEGFLMGTTTTPAPAGCPVNGVTAINSGFIEPQETGTFSNSSISGNYFFGLPQYQPVTSGTVMSGLAASTGNGTVNFTTDSSSSSGVLTTGQSQAVTLTLSTPPPNGRFTDKGGGIYYVISASKFVRLFVSGTAPVLVVGEQ